MTRVCIVTASGQNVFFGEILDAFGAALRRRGVEVTGAVDHFPDLQDDLVYMFVPHEYMPFVDGLALPSAAQLSRTVAVTTEQPGTQWFDTAADIAVSAGAIVDINRLGAAELRRRGLDARLVPLAYIPEWDAWQGNPEARRELDVCFMGGHTLRRADVLAKCASFLRERTSALMLVESIVPHRAGATRMVTGRAKWELLAGTSTLLNVHRSALAYMEWHRVIGAVLNGCVVVTEHSLGAEPFQAGEHYLSASLESLPMVLEATLADPARLERVRRAAYDLVRAELPEAHMGEALLDAVQRAADRPLPARRYQQGVNTPMPLAPPRRSPEYELSDRNDPVRAVRMAVKHLVLRQRGLERRLAALTTAGLPAIPDIDRLRYFGPKVAAPRVSVVLTLYNYADHVAEAIRSVALTDMITELELIVVDDASTDDSRAVAQEALERHPWLSATLVGRGRNHGLAAARNLGVAVARAPYLFILDADNAVHPRGPRMLAEALDANPEAGFAYGTLEGFDASGPVGLVSWLDWDRERLRYGNYVDAMALVRRVALEAVGGYGVEPALYGWEDFALWCAMADAGFEGVHVNQMVARYRTAQHSMISLTTIDTSEAWAALLRQFPGLGKEGNPPSRALSRAELGA